MDLHPSDPPLPATGGPAGPTARAVEPPTGWGSSRVWRLDLDAPLDAADRPLLSVDERARAARFVFDRDRGRFEAAHVALRRLLGAVLGRAPEALRFEQGTHGKPRLDDRTAGSFNLSHSAAVGALLWRPDGSDCGIDVEQRRSVRDREAVAAEVFTDRECQALLALEPDRRDAAFLSLWTRKEAVIKALGTGLSLPPRSFEVGLGPGARRVDVRVPAALAGFGADACLSVVDLDLGPDVCAAVAVRLDGAV